MTIITYIKVILYRLGFPLLLLLVIPPVKAQQLDALISKAERDNLAESWNEVANYCYQERKYPDILKEATDKAKQLSGQHNNTQELARAYIYASDLYYQEGDIRGYLSHNRQADEWLQSLPDAYGLREEALNNMATAYGELDKIDSLVYFTQKAIKLNNQYNGTRLQLGNEYQNMAYAYSVMGVPDSSILYSQKTIDALAEARDTLRMLDAYSQMGTVYAKLGQYTDAIQYYTDALDIYKLVENKHNRLYIYTNLAAVYQRIGKEDKALEFSTEAIKDAAETTEKMTVSKLLCNHANYLFRNDKYRSSIDTLRLALPYIQESHHYLGTAYQIMAQDYYALNMTDSCSYYLDRVDELVQKQVFARSEYYYSSRIMLLATQQKYREALPYVEEFIALERVKPMKNVNNAALYNSIAQVLSKGTEDYRRALEYKSKAYSMQDSIYKKETDAMLNSFYARYKTAEKDKAISILQLEKEIEGRKHLTLTIAFILIIAILFVFFLSNRIRRLKKEKEAAELTNRIQEKENEFRLVMNDIELNEMQSYLRGLEAERNRLAKELHDNVSNTLLGINMQLRDVNEVPEKISNEIESLQQSVRSISHELMPPAFKYATLPEVVENYITRLNEKNKTVLSYEISNAKELERLPESMALEIYRIIQEGTSNILKHARAKHGHVTLQLKKNTVCVVISDDGKGFETSKPHTGIGLQIMEDRLKAIHGKLNIQCAPGKGCILDITIPCG